jgi:uncharacterized YccA/Bax inhibitor family protein
MIRSGNPVLKDDTFSIANAQHDQVMTVQGTVWKTWILLALLTWTASWAWNRPDIVLRYTWAWGLGAFALALITIFKKQAAPITAPLYAVVEGLLIGAISLMFERRYPGVVLQAVMLTFGTLGALLVAYQSRLIKVTENFKLGVFAATGGVMLIYLVDMIMRIFGKSVPVIHQASPLGIAFSVAVVMIAAFNLVLDFDFIEQGAERGAPKYMEWYGAFGLMVTLIWLYLEILRLLGKTRDRR